MDLAIVVTVMIAAWSAIMVVLLRNAHNRGLLVEPEGDYTELNYCNGCGCRHRRLYMHWTEDGTYRCAVCCKAQEAHH